MSSLHELLAQEGFEKKNNHKNRRLTKFRDRTVTDESITLPIYICHDRKSFEFSKRRPERATNGSSSSVSSSKRRGTSKSKRSSTSKSLESAKLGWRDDTTAAIDDVAILAVISILSGYVGRYMKDERFREVIREKCYSCLEVGSSTGARDLDQSYNSEIMENMELGIVMIERLVQENNNQAATKNELLQNSIRLFSIVASLNSSKNRFTCGVSNSNLSACAQLYLSIVYKLEENERTSARHLLQVFCDSPFMARTLLLPDLWERFFLPHLLHLKVWYNSETEIILSDSSEITAEKEERLRALSRAYGEQMDMGTKQFALYYKEWLKADVVKAVPPIPSVPLPPIPSKRFSGIRPSSSSLNSHSPNTGKNIYQVIFGPTHDRQQVRSIDIGNVGREEVSMATWDCEEEQIGSDEDYSKFGSSFHSTKGSHRRMSSSQIYRSPKAEVWTETKKSDYLSFFLCRTEPENEFIHRCQVPKNDTFIKEHIHEEVHLPPSNFSTAVATISSSDNLNDCEIAIRVVAKSWLDSNGDSIIETSLSKPPVIEGILEVLFTSKDDEILELAVSVLAELVARNQVNRRIILNSDPQLEIFMKLLRSSSLFLKSSVLLYLLKPQAKQMLSTDWVALVLRVLEFGEQSQTLFAIKCSPQVAAFYLLDQLLTGFDVDRNVENARKVISLGGLSLLVRRLDVGNCHERINAALFISSCIKADGRCRYYLANHVKKGTILELLAIENQSRVSSIGRALSLLIELLSLNRRSHITKFLIGLKNNEGCINTMHLLFVYLQHAPPEHRPLVAAILFQLDLLEDHMHCSVYREEVVDTIIESLDCKTCNEKVQEQSGRALLLLGGRFLYSGEASTENWLLKQAGFHENIGDSFNEKEIMSDEEGRAAEEWLRKVAMALLMSGNKRLLTALLGSLVNGLPCLAKASLVTITWLMQFIKDTSLGSMACSILVPQLLETLNYDRQIEERVLASSSILSLVKINRECPSKHMLSDTDIIGRLRQLSLVTWTAEELLSIVTCGLNHRRIKLEIIPS